MIDTAFSQLSQLRAFLHSKLAKASDEVLFRIPEGFNNSPFWNIAHLVVTQQLLVYKLSGLPLCIPEEWVTAYGKGSKPNATRPSQEEVKAIWESFLSLPERTSEDYKAGKFKDFHAYETSTGVVLHSVEEAILFNNFHEGAHTGYILAQVRAK